jgi:hypothetical protein
VLCFCALASTLQKRRQLPQAASVHAEVRAKVLRVDPLAGKLSLTLRPSAVDGADTKSTAGRDAADGGAVSDEEADLDEEMAARLDDEVPWIWCSRVSNSVVQRICPFCTAPTTATSDVTTCST